ncbi:Uncharacterised protein [Mycobacteroides abscessus subsp. abscessus]|uniref:Uncharacterized protein n=1 Tax=Mycobacteroides abscessus TaxID=36809 RepID=A0AB33TDY0_9MYCO|nr:MULTISPECIES: hypothetical protein [Mycobacteroides]CPT66581.1 Uncharacterised protein [Mycobacteroides abscessus]CPT77321.1 Uncharacterised protein [Mycobacteroides abscessus]CPV17682.1 Uncharacterised protein [Mycobacteroides abscessus]CPW64716.1 Uncharacterised protein [Mycobacteroides abscessus]CPX77850.1 Uncharacterised protein [Mycobacteroides abscessus]
MIENTSQRHPIEHLVGCLDGNTSNYIEGMEQSGQQQLLKSDLLPADAGRVWSGEGDGMLGINGWDVLEQWGFQRGESVEADPLFVCATLPEGWSRKGSEHAMHSTIVDDRGVERVSVFYKAAFYDRRASMSVITDPGGNLGSNAIYGDAAVALPDEWSVLTTEEREGFRGALDSYLRRADEYPDIYGDRVPRVRDLVALVEAAA